MRALFKRPPSALFVVDYSLCCALGKDVAAARRCLYEAESGLRENPFALSFAAPSGVVAEALPPPPTGFERYDTRQLRLLLSVLMPLLPRIEASVLRFGKTRVALVLGSSNAGLDTTEQHYARYVRDGQTPADFSLRKQHDFAALLTVTQHLTGIAGPVHTVSTACSSSGKAFASAGRLVAAGLADAVLVGGIDALCEMTLRGFRSLGVLAEEACMPFSSARSGINIGEGAAMFLLAREPEAPLALLGTGESADAHHMTAPDPRGEGAERAMREALAQAKLGPTDIDLVNAHATGRYRAMRQKPARFRDCSVRTCRSLPPKVIQVTRWALQVRSRQRYR